MCDELSGLDFSFESLPAELLVNPENDILKGLVDSELDLDCLLNSNLIDDNVDQVSGNPNIRNGITIVQNQSNPQTILTSTSDVKAEPLGLQNQSPVLESLLKSANMSSPCVNPAPQASNTSFAPTITGRNQCITETASPIHDGISNDKEAILAALLRRHEEDRKLLGHLVNDMRREQVVKETVSSSPIQVTNTIPCKQTVSSPSLEQSPIPAQVVVTAPVTSRPVGIISGTRMFVTTPAVDCPSPEMAESMDIGDDDYAYDDEPTRPKTKRRSSHNAIEKRYRLSINTRIDELRTLLDGADSKLSKSAVLRRAIERVRSLEKENALLRKELNLRNSTVRLINPINEEMKHEYRILEESESSPDPTSGSITSPGSSIGGSPPHSPHEQVLTGAGAKAPRLAHLLMKQEPPINVHYPAVTSRARICLAGFFLSLFLFNPMVFWKSSEEKSFVSLGGAVVPGGRTLFSYMQRDSSEQRYSRWFIFSCITGVLMMILAFILKRFGNLNKSVRNVNAAESTVSEELKKKDDVEFLIWRHWKQAEAHIAERSWTKTASELKSVLIAMGQPFPISQLDWYTFVINNILCFTGVRQSSSFNLKPDTSALGYKSLSKLLALASHGYLPLTFFQRSMLTFVLWIGIRRAHLKSDERCQAYINMSFLHSLVNSRFRRQAAESLQISSTTEVPIRLRWLLNPEGYKFLIQYQGSSVIQKPILSSEFDADPSRIDLTEGVSLIGFAFRRKLLEEALTLLAAKDEQRLEEVLGLLTLLIEYSSNAELLDDNDGNNGLESDNGMDHAQFWWSNVASVAALWHQEKWDKSRSLHSIVDSPPRVIKLVSELHSKRLPSSNRNSSAMEVKVNQLAHAVLLAYRIQRRCIFGPSEVPRPCGHNALKMADEAAHILETILQDTKEQNQCHWVMSIVACHWLLTSRISLSQHPNSSGGTDESQIQKFERDLSILQGSLKRASLHSDAFRRWSVMHQARLRLWRGSHPVRTALSLRRDDFSAKSRKDGESEENDTAAEIAHVREWLHQRLMRPRSGMNGVK